MKTLADSDDLGHAPLRILMGRQTNRETTDVIEERQNLREGFGSDLEDDIESLNDAQLGCLERLRDFIADGLVQVRVRNPENGYFHAKGAAFRAPTDDENDFRPDDQGTRSCAAFVVL